MKNRTGPVATLAGIIIGGLAYWFQPYNQPTAFGINMWVLMGIGAFLGAFVLMLFLHENPLKMALFVSLGVIIAVLARIIYDMTLRDSTSHNLFPFEIIISAAVTVPVAFAGAYLGLLLKNIIRKVDRS